MPRQPQPPANGHNPIHGWRPMDGRFLPREGNSSSPAEQGFEAWPLERDPDECPDLGGQGDPRTRLLEIALESVEREALDASPRNPY
jgi:hypothetical protein